MKICIDSLGVTRLRGTGMGTYTHEFLNNLMEMYPQPKYELLWDNPQFELKVGKSNKVSFINLNINRKENDYSTIEKHITDNKIDIYHCPNNGLSVPENKNCHYVTTVHDLLPLINSSYVDEKYREKFSKVFANAVKNSDKIITVSEFLKEQLKNNFDIAEKKIEVIYPGCSQIFTVKNEESCSNILKSKYGVEGDYILHVGSIHIRKNLDKLIRAFKDIYSVNKELKLVFVGKNDGKRSEYYLKLKTIAEELNIGEAVVFLGTVDYDDMPYFYSKAKCVVNLSKYEGFPMVAIEAMNCDTPVVWNRQSFFKEVLGSAGLSADANDKEELVDIISEAAFNNDIREGLLKKQREQAGKYKWEKNIIKTIRIYEEFF